MANANGKITWTNEQRKLSDLIPWDINPATISKDAAKRLEESLDEFGQVETIAISPENEIYDGHQRQVVWGASAKFGADYVVDVRVSSRQLTERERKKLVIFLRKGTVGQFDYDLLANNWELDDLLEWGFDRKELDLDLWAGPVQDDPGAQMDKAEELREKWGVQSGQLWRLGEHRLICGDCTDRAIVERVMMGEKADIVFTDPPYGMNLDADFSGMEGIGIGNKYSNVIGDNKDYDPAHIFKDFDYCKEIFLWGADYYAERIPNRNNGSWIVWDKMGGGNGVNDDYDKMFGSNFELCWSRQKHKRAIARILWKGIFGLDKEPEHKRFHPTQKPVDLSVWFLEKFSDKNNIIVDLFFGVGSLFIACERLGRKCRAVEISPAYCAVSIQRWVDMTGGIPELVE